MGVAGEIAAEHSSGSGSFQMHFLDALFSLSETEIKKRCNLRNG
jgi:hydroxyethylthiazole kinase